MTKKTPNQAYFSEIFTSLEGEGAHVGCPTLFLRFFGCNLTCPGFNNPGNMSISEIAGITITSPQSVPPAGCDSIYSWHPNFKDRRVPMTVDTAVEIILSSLQNKAITRVSFTGGEPMLQQDFMARVISAVDAVLGEEDGPLSMSPFCMNIETNGTIKLSDELSLAIRSACFLTTFSVSPKLENSGEPAVRRSPQLLRQVLGLTSVHSNVVVCIKFVVGCPADVEEALEMVAKLHLPRESVFLMPEAVTKEQQREIQSIVAKLALVNGLNYSHRLHLELYDNAAGT